MLLLGAELYSGTNLLPWPTDSTTLIVYPNPMASAGWIQVMAPRPARVRVHLITLAGEAVGIRELGEVPAGRSRHSFYTEGLATGIYFAVMEIEEEFGYRVRGSFKLAIVK
jgi:hypothetical protein